MRHVVAFQMKVVACPGKPWILILDRIVGECWKWVCLRFSWYGSNDFANIKKLNGTNCTISVEGDLMF